MKLAIYFSITFFLLTVTGLAGQTSNAVIKLDSSFTLTRHLRQDKLSIGQHGVAFNERTEQVLRDFNYINLLSLTDLTKYEKQIVQDGEYLLKVWTAKNPSASVVTIIEINSVYRIDTTEDGSKLKDTVTFNDYFFQLKDTSKNVHYQTVYRQGVSRYSIGNRQVNINREMILTGLFYVDHTDRLKKLLDKHNYAQQVHWH